jgi:nucleotide-binding universal stress UspA family protein
MDRRMLVATNGEPGSMGALRVALALASRGANAPLVVTVQEPVTIYDMMAVGGMTQEKLDVEKVISGQLRATVEAQLREAGADVADWEIRVEVGSPAAVIADAARYYGIDLILLGLGRHGLPERWLGGETALRVMQLAHVPVLAVHPEAAVLPQRALVADDFGGLGREAGLLAVDLLAPAGEVHLAHVVAMPAAIEGELLATDWIDEYLAAARSQLDSRRQEMESAIGTPVRGHALQGDPVHELLRLAEEIGADLIAAGRHGRGFLGRLVMGSVSTSLVRGAKCSVLIVPPPAAQGTVES